MGQRKSRVIYVSQFMRIIIVISILQSCFILSAWAVYPHPQVAPLRDIYIPIKGAEILARANSFRRYKIVEQTKSDYLVIYKPGATATIARIPKINKLGNPTGDMKDGWIEMRTPIIVDLHRGYVPFISNRRYDVVGETETDYAVEYRYDDYSTKCYIAKTSVVYFAKEEVGRENIKAEREKASVEAMLEKQEEANRARRLAAIDEQNRIQSDLLARRQEEERKRAEEAKIKEAEIAALRRRAEEDAERNRLEIERLEQVKLARVHRLMNELASVNELIDEWKSSLHIRHY